MPFKIKKTVIDMIKKDFVLIDKISKAINKSPYTVRDYLAKGNDSHLLRIEVLLIISEHLGIDKNSLYE